MAACVCIACFWALLLFISPFSCSFLPPLPFPILHPRNLTVNNLRPDLVGLVQIQYTLCTEITRSIKMTESKFVEILDNSFVPRSQANANLDDVLAETRARSSSASSASSESLASSSRTSSSSERGQRPTSISGPLTMRLRSLSLRKPKT